MTTRNALLVQGLYYLTQGLWPVLHLESFLSVTGPKRETWLVKAFGLLTAVLGFGLLRAAQRDAASWRQLAATGAATLAGVDVYYVAKRRISPVYLLDAAAECVIMVLLGLTKPPS